MSKVLIYCDGGCRGNQEENNIGGWGILFTYGENTAELYGSERNTTNNIMELTACIKALEQVDGNTTIPIEIHCDSAYVVNGMKVWTKSWIKNGWKTANKKPVKNKDLWMRLVELVDRHKDLEFVKVKGHSTNKGNNIADGLANKAMDEASI